LSSEFWRFRVIRDTVRKTVSGKGVGSTFAEDANVNNQHKPTKEGLCLKQRDRGILQGPEKHAITTTPLARKAITSNGTISHGEQAEKYFATTVPISTERVSKIASFHFGPP
jgi:hypothetical protein